MPSYPQIQSLKIRNFKGIAKLDLPLDASLTLLAGVNGVGKTSAIEALLGAVTDLWSWLGPNGQEAWFSPPGDLVRYGAPEGKITLDLAFEDGVKATCDMPVKTVKLGGIDLNSSEVLLERRETAIPIPLVVYYDQNRIGGLVSRAHMDISETNRKAALDTTPRALSDFKNWYYEKEGDEAREARERNDLGYSDPEVRAVREVLTKVAGDSAALRSRKPDGSMDRMLFLRKNDGFDIPFGALSGGEKAFFLLAVDLARRLLLEFPDKSLAEAPGFVCIDEIELHLHPAWQRTILTSLMDLFPLCQFVVSTHSPQVIGSVASKQLRPLVAGEKSGCINVAETIASKGRDSNYVLEGILDTTEQDPDVDRLFREFDELIDAGAFEEADEVLDELDGLIEGPVAPGCSSPGEMQASAPGVGMRGSAKGEEPEALRDWKAAQRDACIQLRYSDLAGNPKQATGQALFIEQTGQCVYCGRGIDLEEHGRYHIEHFRPRALYPNLELAYGSLFLSCGPQQREGSPQPTCGNRKDNWFDEDCHVEPVPENNCQHRFVFASSGMVQGDGALEADRMIEVLNLNHGELVADRSALIEDLDGELANGVSLHELIKGFDHVFQNGAWVSFANVAVQYLQKQGACAQDA